MDPRSTSKQQPIPGPIIESQVSINVRADQKLLDFLRGEFNAYEASLAGIGYSSENGHSVSCSDITVALHDNRVQARAWLRPQYAAALGDREILQEINIQIAKQLGEDWSIVVTEPPRNTEDLSEGQQLLKDFTEALSARGWPLRKGAISIYRRLNVSGFPIDEDIASLEVPPAGFLIVEFRSKYVETATHEVLQSEIESFAKLVKSIVDGYHKHKNTLPPPARIDIRPETNSHHSRSYSTSTEPSQEISGEKVAAQGAPSPDHLVEQHFREELKAIEALADDPKKKRVAVARVSKLLSQLELLRVEAEGLRDELTSSDTDH